MAQVTAPVILDSTGQQIVTALNNLSNNVKPTADQIKRTSSNNQTVEAALVSLNSKIAKYQGTRAWVAGANCNDYTTEGLYMLSDNLTNAPLTWFTLIVYAPRNDAITQFAMKTPNEIYIRFYTSSWSAWDKLALNSQLANKVTTGTMVVACNAGKTQVSYANLPSGKPDSQGKFLQSLYQCVNHGSAAEMTTVCIDGVDLIIQTATAQNVTIRWFYFGTV